MLKGNNYDMLMLIAGGCAFVVVGKVVCLYPMQWVDRPFGGHSISG